MEKEDNYGYQLASKGKRLLASLTEAIIFGVFFLLIYLALGISAEEFWNDINADFKWIDLLYSLLSGIVVGALLYPFFTGNLGHKIYNLKVISAETGEDYKKPELGALRESLKHILGYLIIPSIWILWDKKNQNLYDKITKTLVVENNK